MFFRLLLAIDAIAALVILYFFMIGLADGSVSSFNMELWFGVLAAVAAILGGGLLLKAKASGSPPTLCCWSWRHLPRSMDCFS